MANVKITGVKQTLSMIDKKKKKAAKILRNLNHRIENVVRTLIRENFREEATSEGDAWAALSPAYAARKAAAGSNKILVGLGGKGSGGGQLRATAIQSGLQRLMGNTLEVLMDTTKNYAVFIEFGTSKMPARSYFNVAQKDVDSKIVEIVDAFMMRD